MSADVMGSVARNNNQIYSSIAFQIDRMSTTETFKYPGVPPLYLYNGFCTGIYDLRQNDYIVDLFNVNPVTQQPKAYQIVNEPEPFPDNHMEFDCARADRAAIARVGG